MRKQSSEHSKHQNRMMDGKAVYKRLLKEYALPFWPLFLMAIFANIAFSFIDALFINATQKLLDEGLIAKDPTFLETLPFYVVAMTLARGLFDFLATYLMNRAGYSVVQKIRQSLFQHMLILPRDFYSHYSTGELISKITYNTENVMRATTSALKTFVKEGAFLIFALGSMFWHSVELSLYFIIAAPFIAIVVKYTTKRFRRLSGNIQDAMGGITQVSEEVVRGHQDVKMFSAEQQETARFENAIGNNFRQSLKMAVTKACVSPITQFFAISALALVIYKATEGVMAGRITPGSFVTILGFMMLILRPLRQLTRINSVIQQGIAGASSIFEILDMAPESDNGQKLTKVDGKITFDHVHFTYQNAEKPALDDFNLSILPGETVALVGRSGSGKSTLMQLLMHFHAPTSGRILIDDQDIAEIKRSSLRANMAFVSQQINLFNDTVYQNIAYGSNANKKSKEIFDAAKSAHVTEFVENLPQGYETVIGDNGSLLSGGQRQRVAIARAFLKNAPILLLDEATSALDNESERVIQSALQTLSETSTTIVIAHRLSTVEKADKIVVMDAGKIVQIGTHADLIKAQGLYQHLYEQAFSDH